MKLNQTQIVTIGTVIVLCGVIFIFATNRKPKDNVKFNMNKPQEDKPADALDIVFYINETKDKIADKAIRQKIERLEQANEYDSLITTYIKLDKPLAVAYYRVKVAEKSNKAADYSAAGDYSVVLTQTAPDEKALNYLMNNVLACYQKAAELDTINVDYKIKLASAYIEGSQQPMQGVGILLDVVQRDSNNVEAQLMLGHFGIVSGQYDKAIVRLEKVLYLQPQNLDAAYYLAQAYAGKGNRSKAIDILEDLKTKVTNTEEKKQIEDFISNLKKPG